MFLVELLFLSPQLKINLILISVKKNDIPTPTVRTKKRKRVLASEEVSIIGKKVTVYRSGRVKILEDASESDEDDSLH